MVLNSIKIKKDLFGTTRSNQNSIGAITDLATAEKFIIDKSLYGPSWFDTKKIKKQPKTHLVSSKKRRIRKCVK